MTDSCRPTLVVGIPARDEVLLIRAALASVVASADALTDSVAVIVVVACDTCADGTRAVVEAMAADDERVIAIEGVWRSAGAARAAAFAHGLQPALAHTRPSDVWLATTDADTVVSVDWLSQHVACWASGDHAVAGIVNVSADGAEGVAAAFRRNYGVCADAHDHVHGANLGVRGDAYLAVGGFPALALAEDHAIWRALLDAGFRCRSSVSLRVSTSARLVGRARGGFADTLARWAAAECPLPEDDQVPA